MEQLRGMTYHGIPDDTASLAPNLRQTVWKVGMRMHIPAVPSDTQLLLGYLPPERAEWDAAVAAKRQQYAQYCSELIIDPSSFRDGGAVPLVGGANSADQARAASVDQQRA